MPEEAHNPGAAKRILRRLGISPARYVWQHPKAHVLFHYTEPDYAEAIFDEGLYLVSDRPHQVHGHGFFATNIVPGEFPDERLLTVLFANQRPVSCIEGVVVLVHAAEFGSLGGRHFRWPAAAGEILDISEIALGFGRRSDGKRWTFSDELHIA